jgi:hypothetical protein
VLQGGVAAATRSAMNDYGDILPIWLILIEDAITFDRTWGSIPSKPSRG